MTARYYVGDVRAVLASLPANSVDLVMTSPPFLGLRAYLPADHPDKQLEMGSEPTPGEFIDALLDVVEACDRVLAPHGSICIELGDTYSGSGASGGDYREGKRKDGWPKFSSRLRGGPLGKSLCLIPESFRWALAYGRNPFNGRETDRWRVRNVVRWCRPNPPVGELGDKVRPATSDIVIACKSRTRYFDLDAIRGEGSAPPLDHWWHDDTYDQDAWLIPTAPYKGAHYATYPPLLCVRPILAMCPKRVCTECGEPSRRVTEPTPKYRAIRDAVGSFKDHATDATSGRTGSNRARDMGKMTASQMVTTGWTGCDCPGEDKWRTGVVLDPFAGTGTTLAVALGHGRDAVGIDLDARNAELARERVGMFLEVMETVA